LPHQNAAGAYCLPGKALHPKTLPMLSRPLVVLPWPFLCAMLSLLVLRTANAAPVWRRGSHCFDGSYDSVNKIRISAELYYAMPSPLRGGASSCSMSCSGV
jgi:hypothetical protein